MQPKFDSLAVFKFVQSILLHFLAGLRIFFCIFGLIIAVPMLHIESWLFGYTAERGFKYRRWFTRYYILVLNIRIRKEGFSDGDNCLFVCNHRMMIDPVIILNYCKGYIVSKAEVADYPVLGSGAKNAGVVFVQRDKRSSRAAVKEEIGRLLSSGDSVVIFPEGTVNTGVLTAVFSRGSFDEAAKCCCSVVPVALDYRDPGVYWGANISLIRHFMEVFKRPALFTKICFGPAIKSTDGNELMEKSRAFIDGKLAEWRSEWSKS